MDYLTVPTIDFKELYVLVILCHDRRIIQHTAVPEHPTAEKGGHFSQHPCCARWTISPLFARFGLLRDGSVCRWGKRRCLAIAAEESGQRCQGKETHHSCALGIPPYGPYAFIPLNAHHLQRLLNEYVQRYYNPVRTHQGIERQTPLPPVSPPEPAVLMTPLQATPVLGGLYHTYKRAA
jgi:putative transposase